MIRYLHEDAHGVTTSPTIVCTCGDPSAPHAHYHAPTLRWIVKSAIAGRIVLTADSWQWAGRQIELTGPEISSEWVTWAAARIGQSVTLEDLYAAKEP